MNNDNDRVPINTILDHVNSDGTKPEIIVVTSLRTDGKTTGTFIEMVKRNIVFAMLYRSFGECKNCELMFDNVFKILGLPLPNFMAKCIGETFYTIYEDNEPFCYAIPIDKAEQIKRRSNMFSGVNAIILDEYQSITGRYCKEEIKKVLTIQISIARGINQYSRYVPLILLGNYITPLNPWTIHFGLESMKRASAEQRLILKERPKFLAVSHFNETASNSMAENGVIMNIADRNEQRAIEGNYMFNADNFIMPKVTRKKFKYICNIVIDGKMYAVRHFDTFIYCSHKPDMSIKTVYTLDKDCHNDDTLLFTRQAFPCKIMTEYYNSGCLYFDNLATKNDILKAISISLF